MAHRQTYREGPPTPDEYDAIFDSDPAEQAPYYNKRYESHLYQTEQEKAQEIFRLLRALSEHLMHKIGNGLVAIALGPATRMTRPVNKMH